MITGELGGDYDDVWCLLPQPINKKNGFNRRHTLAVPGAVIIITKSSFLIITFKIIIMITIFDAILIIKIIIFIIKIIKIIIIILIII